MVYFHTEKNFEYIFRAWEFKMWVYFIAIKNFLGPFRTFHGHLVYFVVSWNIFTVFVCCNLAILIKITFS
jgi:hypothetical protein